MNRRHPLPAEVYALVEQTPATVLLEGGKPDRAGSQQIPWTQLFTAPLRVCAPFTAAEIPDLFATIESAVAAGQCVAGFFSYECGNCFEPKAGLRAARPDLPLAWFGIYERSYAFDYQVGSFVDGEPPELQIYKRKSANAPSQEREVYRNEHEVPGQDFSRAGDAAKSTRATAPEPELTTEFAVTEAEYARRIAAIHEWIRAGDVYQLNFTAPFRVKVRGSGADLYAQLRARQPVDYGAFLHWEAGRHILSFSPELFFRVDQDGAPRGGRRIVTRPMKGTAPRGRTTREDREIAEWLRNDPKNRSENVMIVDLLRNDLGRVAQFGTVRAEELFAVERFSTLWQMTSTVSAELRPEVGFHDIFRALFPCGSVTGAPKVRAMQLLARLEGEPRGVYTGAIGFFSPRQTVFNVAIRTLELNGERGRMGAGSGIVTDSDPAEEFRECLLKAKFLTGSANPWPQEFSLIETMLWDGAYPLLELHLDRLTDSAEYFDFACDRATVKAALLDRASTFPAGEPRKVRLLLDAGGVVRISDEVLELSRGEDRISCVRIAEARTDPADRMLYHKTTHRALYATAFQQAARDGLDDMLFLNLRGEVTEGAISNIFIEKDGRWFTPPIECGLLAGVYRRHLLETRPNIEQRVLSLDDLRHADAIHISNAVRGLRRAEINW